jgi:hypothetical protein
VEEVNGQIPDLLVCFDKELVNSAAAILILLFYFHQSLYQILIVGGFAIDGRNVGLDCFADIGGDAIPKSVEEEVENLGG